MHITRALVGFAVVMTLSTPNPGFDLGTPQPSRVCTGTPGWWRARPHPGFPGRAPGEGSPRVAVDKSFIRYVIAMQRPRAHSKTKHPPLSLVQSRCTTAWAVGPSP